jgi:septal ring factor EnvC (AmiA/AmiB activator)
MPRIGTTAGTSILVLLAALALPSGAQDANPVSEIDTLTQQWTDLEHQKDVLRADWRMQKPVLEQQLRLIERETAELTALLETTAAQRDEVEQRRLELLTEQTELEEESAALDASLARQSN